MFISWSRDEFLSAYCTSTEMIIQCVPAVVVLVIWLAIIVDRVVKIKRISIWQYSY